MSQKTAVRGLIWFLCGGAGVLIALILAGGTVDRTTARVIGTAVAIAGFSLTAVAGSNLTLRRPELRMLGYLTVGVSVVAFGTMVISIWAESLWGSGDGWRPAVYTLILALAAGHTAILLAGGGSADDQAVRQVRGATILALWILVTVVFIEISSPGPDLGIEVIGVFAVLYLLGVLLLPLVRRSGAIGRSPDGTGAKRKATAVGRKDGISLSLDHLVIGVADWDRSAAFYRDVLGAEILELEGARMAYRIGPQQLNVHGPGTEAAPLALDPVRPGNSDLCFAWNGSAAAAADHLRSCGVEVLAGPVPRDGALGTGLSVYCRDPDGSLIELIAYA